MEVCEGGKVMMAEYINNNVVENTGDTLEKRRRLLLEGMGWMSEQQP